MASTSKKKAASRKAKGTASFAQRLRSMAIIGVLKGPMILPYRARLSVIAWLMTWVVAPLAGYSRRIRENLAHACPELPEEDVKRLCRAVPANTGRMLMEQGSGTDFTDTIDPQSLRGPGVADLDAARDSGTPILLVSGHFGNFDAIRFALSQRGHKVGALYRPIDDPVLDKHFLDMLTAIAAPIFPRGRTGLGQMLRFLRKGNAVAILPDQFVHEGAPLTFFGQPAPTSLSAAEMALKYNALLIPVYGIRTPDGFDLVAEAPIAHSDPLTMSQAVNDSLEARVREHMDQWLWIHRRWKPEVQRRRAAAKTSSKPSR